jgi:hypothetical protein
MPVDLNRDLTLTCICSLRAKQGLPVAYLADVHDRAGRHGRRGSRHGILTTYGGHGRLLQTCRVPVDADAHALERTYKKLTR